MGVGRIVALEEVGDEILEALGLGEKGDKEGSGSGGQGWAWEA
jgi:hypothetical protein